MTLPIPVGSHNVDNVSRPGNINSFQAYAGKPHRSIRGFGKGLQTCDSDVILSGGSGKVDARTFLSPARAFVAGGLTTSAWTVSTTSGAATEAIGHCGRLGPLSQSHQHLVYPMLATGRGFEQSSGGATVGGGEGGVGGGSLASQQLQLSRPSVHPTQPQLYFPSPSLHDTLYQRHELASQQPHQQHQQHQQQHRQQQQFDPTSGQPESNDSPSPFSLKWYKQKQQHRLCRQPGPKQKYNCPSRITFPHADQTGSAVTVPVAVPPDGPTGRVPWPAKCRGLAVVKTAMRSAGGPFRTRSGLKHKQPTEPPASGEHCQLLAGSDVPGVKSTVGLRVCDEEILKWIPSQDDSGFVVNKNLVSMTLLR
ncbi:unnamed protein product [Protopolystoma xenopodis]|uniref:Uncharacterized protein n=1 Tax=Protopolystoma xenopodis TaxID=117903 RepID=A0A3S5A5E3_9PLAT|nr:unnamed protein product [Protopolystoma xenopodis]